MKPRLRRRLLFAAAAGAVLLLRWQKRKLQREADSGESATLIWQRPSTSSNHLCKAAAAIINCCASLRSPRYEPTPWASWQLANMILLEAKCQLLGRLLGRLRVHRQMVIPDVYLDWADDEGTRALPASAPIVAFLHTITGGGEAQDDQNLRLASARGFRAVNLIRRGHSGAPLASRAQWSLLGDVADTRAQVAAVRARFPHADFLGMVGLRYATSATTAATGCNLPFASLLAWPLPSRLASRLV